MSVSLPFHPRARLDDLVVNQVEREMLVFDQRSNHIHQLDAVSAATWRLCDGQHAASDLARLVSQRLGEPVAVASVEMALDQLAEAGLLLEAKVATGPRASRRSLVRKAAVGGTMAVPVIVSISAPQAAAVQSTCIDIFCPTDEVCCYGGACDGAGNCCSGAEVCRTDQVCCNGGLCDGAGNCCGFGYHICQNDGVCCPPGMCVDEICSFPG